MNKKLAISLGTVLSAGAVAAMIAVPVMNQTSGSIQKEVMNLDATVKVATATKPATFNPYEDGPIISQGNARNLWAKVGEVRDPNKWYSKRVDTEFDNYDGKLAFEFAKKYGWSEDDFRDYVHFHYDVVVATDQSNTFGDVCTTGSSWMAWHPQGVSGRAELLNKGSATMTNINGMESPLGPSYDGAEKVEANKIDNNLEWYGYQDSKKTFVFDQNNLSNAFRRLTDDSLLRLHKVGLDEVQIEAGLDGTKDIRRNDGGNEFVMLNGSLTKLSAINPGANYYYVSFNGDENYVRDENGWKVIVSDDPTTWGVNTREDALKKLFTTVLNPINKGGDLETGLDAVVKISKDGKTNDQAQRPVFAPQKLKGSSKLANYGSDPTAEYAANKTIDYGTYTYVNPDKAPKKGTDPTVPYNVKDIAISTMGVYKLTYSASSWLDLCKERGFILPDQKYAGEDIFNKDRQIVATSHNMWEGGDMDWTWAEDGHGGRKIWKKINIMSPRTWATQPDSNGIAEAKEVTLCAFKFPWGTQPVSSYTSVKTQIYDNPQNPTHKFWGNYNHIFWNRSAFLANEDYTSDGGY